MAFLLSPKIVPTTSHTTKLLNPLAAPLLPAAHLAVLAAKNGDDTAKAIVASTVAQADDRFGPPAAVATADVLDQAAKMQVRARFVQYWLFGEGASIAAGLLPPRGISES